MMWGAENVWVTAIQTFCASVRAACAATAFSFAASSSGSEVISMETTATGCSRPSTSARTYSGCA